MSDLTLLDVAMAEAARLELDVIELDAINNPDVSPGILYVIQHNGPWGAPGIYVAPGADRIKLRDQTAALFDSTAKSK